MNKYILINKEAKSVVQNTEILGLIPVNSLIDYDVDVVAGGVIPFRTYESVSTTISSLNINLVLSTELQADKQKAKELFLKYFIKSLEDLSITSTSSVIFYPPTGISIGTISI